MVERKGLMSWIQHIYYVIAIVLDEIGARPKKKKNQLVSPLSSKPISAAQKKPSLVLYPVLLWWRWVYLCSASFDATSEGALSCSQTLINWQARHFVGCQSPLPVRPGIRVRTNSIRLSVKMCRMGKHGLFIVVSVCQLSANSQGDSSGWCLNMQSVRCCSIRRLGCW